jgi:AraC-like DNA-binding protein
MEPSDRDYRLQVIEYGISRDFWHWNHKNLASPFWRLYWNEKPGASLDVAGKVIALTPSQVYLIPPMTVFSKTSRKPVPHFSVHFTAGPTLDAMGGRAFCFACDSGLRSAISRIIRLIDAGESGSIECDIRATALVATMLQRMPPDAYAHLPGDARTNAVCRYIDENYASRITIETLAALCGMSRRGLHKLFARQTGLTPFGYVIRTRINKAAALLHTTGRTIDQIAGETGFCDRNHFTRLFVRHMGRGPGAYRKQLGR